MTGTCGTGGVATSIAKNIPWDAQASSKQWHLATMLSNLVIMLSRSLTTGSPNPYIIQGVLKWGYPQIIQN